MLINYQALWLSSGFLLRSTNIGSIQLPIVLKLDSSLSVSSGRVGVVRPDDGRVCAAPDW